MSKVVILGCKGLVGRRLASQLSKMSHINLNGRTQELKKCLLVTKTLDEDQIQEFHGNTRMDFLEANIVDREAMEKAVDPDSCDSVNVIHLAALLSGYSEENFDLGMEINVHGTFNVMDRMREVSTRMGSPQQYIYVSTDYVNCFNEFNRTNPVTEESFRLSPVSYGVQKAAMELFICDYSRKGFIDGRVGRISAVIGRPGFSNSISYPYTGIFTQPLEGKDYDVSLPLDIPFPISSLNNNCEGLIHFLNVRGEELGHNRVVQLPAKSYTLNDIWAATQEVAEEMNLTLGTMTPTSSDKGETTIKEINVCPFVDCSKAERLGFPMNVDVKDIIRDYVRNYILTR